MKDFEPRDAIPYMCSRQIINDDQQEAILRMPARVLRVSEFIRQYRRSANDLEPLVSYFEKYGQKHLASILSRNYLQNDRPLLTEKQINFRLSVDANVPHRLYNYVERNALIQSLEKLLIELASRDQFWLVISGFAGCGKSCLAAEVLRSCPVLLSRYYEHVIWIRDGRTDKSQLPALFSNFIVVASDAVVLTGREVTTQFLPLAKAALRDKPNALIVLDDVYLTESVRWFDQLNCRILATSRNVEIFQVASTNFIQYEIQPIGFTMKETANAINSVLATENSSAFMDQVAWVQEKTIGLPALVGIVARLTNGNTESLANLRKFMDQQPIQALNSTTNYWYTNIFDALMESYSMLKNHYKMILETFILFKEDDWIPLELLSLCIEMDVSGEQDAMFTALQDLELLLKLSFLEKRVVGIIYSSGGERPTYDFRTNRIMHSFLRCTVSKTDVESRLHFIGPRVWSYLNDNLSAKADFTMRIRSYTDGHPFLFRELPHPIYTGCRDTETNGSFHGRPCRAERPGGQNGQNKRTNSWSDICTYM